MKFFITIVIGVGLVIMVYVARFKGVEHVTSEHFERVQKSTTDMQLKLLERQEKARIDAYTLKLDVTR